MGKRERKMTREEEYREREQRWRRHRTAWRQSGTSQAEYCRKQGLAPADFAWWKSELARRDALTRRRSPRQPTAPFVPVQVVAGEGVMCEVVLRNGRRLRIGTECEPGWIAKVATALEAASPC